MTVALATCAMRLSEFITIYLAAAAPFGVAHFLRCETRGGQRARALTRALVAALLWPLAAFVMFRKSKDESQEEAGERASDDERRIERTKRALVGALRDVEEIVEPMRGPEGETERHALFAAREAVERYVGLTLAARGLDADPAPTAREMELCRIAGRTGDDLLNAGRCVHRRNVTRLQAHRERARDELFHALAATRETATKRHAASAPPARARAAEALIQAFARAIELLSLLEDRAAVLRVARLLDAECAHLRRLETAGEAFGVAEVNNTHVNVQAPRFGVTAAGGGLKA